MLTLPITAFIFCVLLHMLALREFPKLQLTDFPKRYGLSRSPIPYPTGILGALTFVILYAIIAPWTLQTAGVLLGILILLFTSFRDDRAPIASWIRLGVQAGVAFIIFATGSRIYTLTNPMDVSSFIKLDTIDIYTNILGPLPLLSGIFTILWLMVTINALNWFDGIPGQVNMLSTIGFLTIGCLAISARVDQPELALLAFILSAIACASLIFDYPPNKVLSGDTGAMFFGLMLGVLTIYSGGKVATAFLVLGVPLIDLFLVILHRISKGKSPLASNTTDEHLHHRLRSKGWNDRQIISLTGLLGVTFGISALFLTTEEKLIAAGILFTIMVALSIYTKK
ncbi:MAG: MraY family glycosyltransferase [bacterium]|nr:MraY family glycosyltransferase [bacterium]